MSKIKSYNCGEYGHYACDCPRPCDNANIAQENEQNQEFTNMMDLDNNSVSKECATVCMDVHYEDWDWDIIMYGDQGVCTKEHNEATYTELAVKKNKKLNIMWPYALVILCHLRKNEGNLTKTHLMKMCMT